MDLLAAVQSWQSNPLDLYEPTVGCLPFHMQLSLLRMLRAPNQVGKAQPLDARVLTPTGWTTMGELRVGSEVIAGDGSRTTVVAVHPQGEMATLRLTFDDGATTECTADHLWVVRTPEARFSHGAKRGRWTKMDAGEILRRWGSRPPARHRVAIPRLPTDAEPERVLVSIEPSGRAVCQCISVAHPSATYVTDDYIVTHNTYAGVAEDWWFLTDTHPWRPRHGKAAPKLVILIAQIEKFYREFCEKMHALEPPGILHPSCRYVPQVGYKGPEGAHILILRSGASAVFAGGTGESIGSAGSTADALHVDEPPKAPHLEEALRSVMHRNGPVWMTFTPVGRPVEHLKLRVEGDPENGVEPLEQWTQTVPTLSVESCRMAKSGRLTRDEASIQRQVAAYTGSPNEAQRLRGAWDGVATGRRFPGYNPTKHYTDCRPLLRGVDLARIRLAVDYGEHPETLIAGLMVEAKGVFYVLAERPGRNNGLPMSIAEDMAAMCAEWGIPLSVFGRSGGGLGQIHGDINSLGLSGGGLSANDALSAALASAGFPSDAEVRPPSAGKGRGSVLSGEVAINVMAAQDRIRVNPTCRRVHHGLSYHVAGQQDTKHAIDMVRYGMGDRMIATMGRRPMHSSKVVAV